MELIDLKNSFVFVRFYVKLMKFVLKIKKSGPCTIEMMNRKIFVPRNNRKFHKKREK